MRVTKEVLVRDDPFPLESGAVLPRLEIGFEIYGRLSPARDNAILVCPTMTTDGHAAGRHRDDDRRPGWWDAAIGSGRMLDTDRFAVIAVDPLGGSGATTGPRSIDPATGAPYRLDFPVVTIGDMVRVQRRLIDHLGIDRLAAAIGGCMGGFQVLEWIASHPDRIGRGVAIAVGPRTSAHTIARNEVCRRAIRLDPGWQEGRYPLDRPPARGMGLASMIGSLVWFDRDVLERRFGRRRSGSAVPGFAFAPEFEVEALFERLDAGATARFDPNAFLYLTRAVDYFDLEEEGRSLTERFAGWRGELLAVSYRSDWRYPPDEAERVVRALRAAGARVEHAILESPLGHGAFILDVPPLGEVVRPFLEREAAARRETA